MSLRFASIARNGARTLGVAALLATTLAGAASAQQLTGAGATFPYPIYSKWFDVYKHKTGVEINYQSIGSGAGIQQLKAGTVDFGASDAALNDAKLKAMPAKVLHFPTVGGAVVLAYNLPQLKQRLRLTPEALVGIYMGKITKWNDKAIAAANPKVKLPKSPILPVHRADGSGTTNIFTTYLSAVSAPWKKSVGANTSVSWPAGVGGKGNDGVSGLVRQTPGSIGYVELAYAKQNKLSTALLQNRAGNFMDATLATTTAAIAGATDELAKDVRTPVVNAAGKDAYPIVGLTFLLVYQDQKNPAQAKVLTNFIYWAMHDGQEFAKSLDYARLPESVVKVNEATLHKVMAGGQPVFAGNSEN